MSEATPDGDAVATVPAEATLAERFAQAMSLFPARESGKFVARSTAARVLAEYRALPQPDDDLTLAAVKLLRKMRKHGEALRLLQNRRPAPPGKERAVMFLEMELLFFRGRREEALALLERIEASGKLRPSWRRSVAKIRGKAEASDGRRELLAAERAAANFEGRFGPELLELVRPLYPHGNTALQMLGFLHERLERLQAIDAPSGAFDPAVWDKYHVAQLVFACGFSWSGSGAVAAYLAQHRAIERPFGMSELGWLQGKGERPGFFAFLQEGPVQPADMKKLLARFILDALSRLSSRKELSTPLKTLSKVADGRLLVLGALIDDLARQLLTPECLADAGPRRRVLAGFVERLLSLRGGTHLLLNNVLMAANLELMPWMAHSRFVAVQRDARDQFVARRMESRNGRGLGLDLPSFTNLLRSNRERFAKACAVAAAEGQSGRMLLLKFEDFLASEDTRRQVLDFIGLPAKGIVPDTEKFDLSVSSRNVGIHGPELGPEEAAFLEHELGLYLA